MTKEGCGDGHEGLPQCSDGARGSADERTLSSANASRGNLESPALQHPPAIDAVEEVDHPRPSGTQWCKRSAADPTHIHYLRMRLLQPFWGTLCANAI